MPVTTAYEPILSIFNPSLACAGNSGAGNKILGAEGVGGVGGLGVSEELSDELEEELSTELSVLSSELSPVLSSELLGIDESTDESTEEFKEELPPPSISHEPSATTPVPNTANERIVHKSFLIFVTLQII